MRYFHVTDCRRWGEQVILKPRTPASRSKLEPETPRVCVTPTIAQCVLACECMDQFYAVYYTNETPDVINPPNVFDSGWTQEAWFTRPITLHRLCIFPEKMMFDMPIMEYPSRQFWQTNLHTINDWLNDYGIPAIEAMSGFLEDLTCR